MRSGIYTPHTTILRPPLGLDRTFFSVRRNRSCVPAAASSCALILALFVQFSVAGLILDYSDAPEPGTELSPPGAENIVWDPVYLPATIGGIVGAYAVSLVLVAAILLLLSKRRREHINGVDAPEPELPLPQFAFPSLPDNKNSVEFPYPVTPSKAEIHTSPWADPVSPNSEVSACNPGVDIHVDQRVVRHDRKMAQNQLEEMYRLVMEQEDAKERGIPVGSPPLPADAQSHKSSGSTLSKREKNKPAGLNLDGKKESRTSTFLNALRSPRGKKNQVKGVSISSPLMTPQSGTFPRYDEGQEMNAIPPRQYAPAPPPPLPPVPQVPYSPASPDHSPESTMSIDERLRRQLPAGQYNHSTGHSRNTSAAPSERDPASAISERSDSPLVGLPSSPKPGVNRFPSLPSSPKPGQQSFPRSTAPSAVRTGGALPLRAYESSIASPSQSSFQTTTKQTVFERVGPMSPGGGRTPFTSAAVPYSPYQPQTPCVPITPGLVTKADRKRMKKLEPKTPTLEMVKSSDEVW